VRGGRCNIGNDFICCSYTILPSHRFLRPMGTIFHMKNISTEHSFLKSRICFIYGTVCPYIMCIFEDIYIVRTKNLFCQTLLLVLLQNRALLQSILIEISLLKIIFVPLFCFNKEDFSAWKVFISTFYPFLPKINSFIIGRDFFYWTFNHATILTQFRIEFICPFFEDLITNKDYFSVPLFNTASYATPQIPLYSSLEK
jgi:hypothetical protein